MMRHAILAASAMVAVSAGSTRMAGAQMRPDVAGTEAAVSSDHPLATAAGAAVLRRGGNAVDAAITMAAVLAVVRPHMNGLGGDAFLIIRTGRTGVVRVLNGSGRAGARATLERFHAEKLDRIPSTGILSVSVPGAVRAWEDALREAGTITLAEALAPAIHYAEHGFPVSEKLADDIAENRDRLYRDVAMRAVFLIGGAPPAPGSLLRQPELAGTLRAIAEHGADQLYRGAAARDIARFMDQERGLLTAADLAAHASTWQEPIWTTYAGYRVGVLPPNSQGLALLLQMNMAEQFELKAMGHNSAGYVNTLVEIKKVAFRVRDDHVADPAFADVPVARLVSKEYATQLARELAPRISTSTNRGGRRDHEDGDRAAAHDGDGDTVYICAVDKDGHAVSMIQSLFSAFGSGRMVPGTGIVLHNRGSSYSLDRAHPNVVVPGKRPYHTLSPAILLRPDGSLFMLAGTPGADGQTQTILQVVNNITLFGMAPQRAVEWARWRSYPDGSLQVEPGIRPEVRAALERLGHRVRVEDGLTSDLGGAQVILVDATGAVRTGADPRREAYAIAW
jgi:gamma-glutamyltranspeptidase/glutathione hydrolase